MDKNKKAIQEIQKGIINYTKKEISYAPYDKTKTGIISSIKDDNLYEIKIDNKTYDNVPTTGGICTINETVRVVVPQNNFNNIFILKSGENKSSSGNVESVNGKTGTVILDASDVEALPSSTTIPTKTSDLTNDSNFISSIPNEYVTDTEMQSYAQPIGDYATNKQLVTKLNLSGGNMSGNIDMGLNYINNLPSATLNTQPCTFKQLKDAITGLGTVFNLKGSVATVSNLPTTENKEGDVYYVADESVGYIWIKDTNSILRWEKFGEPIDLSGYLTKNELLQSTGTATDNTMSQNAITTSLSDKISTNGDISNTKNTFIQYSTRTNIASGEKISISFGKIMKWFSDLKTIAFSGSYNDLSDTPTIPSVGNGTITFTQNGTTKGTFTTNQGSNSTIVLTDNNTTYDVATINTNGLMSISDKTKLNGIETGAQVNSITGVKGNDEGTYRTGNVNITSVNVGLGNVPNVSTNNQTPTWTIASVLSNIASGETLTITFGKIAKAIIDLISHITNASNPHNVTKSQVGLSNVDNTNDISKPISTATQTALNSKKNNFTENTAFNKNFETISTNIKGNGTQSVGTLSTIARADHVHPLQTSVSGSSGNCTGNSATATKLQTGRTIELSGGATGTATSFDGSANISIPVTSLDASKLSGTASISTTGNAATATKAIQDANGNVITASYGSTLSLNGSSVLLKSKSGATLSSVTVPTGIIVWTDV